MLVYRRQRCNEEQGYEYAGQQAQTEASGTVQEDEVTSKSPGGTMP